VFDINNKLKHVETRYRTWFCSISHLPLIHKIIKTLHIFGCVIESGKKRMFTNTELVLPLDTTRLLVCQNLFTMRKLLVLLATVFLSLNSTGQKVPKYIQDHVTNRYNGKQTNIRSLIDIDGYYTVKEIYRVCSGPPKSQVCRDTTEVNFIFYEDGTFLYNFFDVDSDYPGNTCAYLERICKGNGTEAFYNRFYWGIYRIEGDTIIAQYIFNSPKLTIRDAWEDKFTVIDRTTIIKVSPKSRSLFKTTKPQQKVIDVSASQKKVLPAKFNPSPYIPEPKSWLKKQEWVHSR
jgi:hypothetical protein